jgi:protein CpxP
VVVAFLCCRSRLRERDRPSLTPQSGSALQNLTNLLAVPAMVLMFSFQDYFSEIEYNDHHYAEIQGDSMKRARTFIFFCIALFAIGAFAVQSQQTPPSQGTQPPAGQAGQGEHRQMPTIDEQVKRLADRLSLTDDQQAKAKSILEDQRTQAQALMKDDSLSQDDKRQKFMSLRQATISKIKDMLNDDQKKKFDEYLQEMQGASKEKPGDGSSPKNK